MWTLRTDRLVTSKPPSRMKFEYTALRVQQQPESQPFYIASVAAPELLEWADVPRKRADFMAGYQRELLPRHSAITDYIRKDPQNIIPGAVIVALPSENVEISEAGMNGIAKIVVTIQEQSFQERLKGLASEFWQRLGPTEQASIAAGIEPELDLIAEEAVGEIGPTGDEVAAEDLPPESYLAELAFELQRAVDDMESLAPDRQRAVRDYVEGLTKPGRILDGQHRVFGAKDVPEFDVMLPVVIIPGLSTSEQVYHFYVLNNKARPLSPTELRSTISTSLSNAEIQALYGRFRQAGVTEAEATRWTHRANTDTQSPFYQLIDFGFGGGFIPENVAYQLVGKFVKLPRKYRLLFDKVEQWKNDPSYDYRLGLFYTLWGVVKRKYPTAWNKAVSARGGQILMKASMLVLQELVMDRLNTSMPGRAAKTEPSPLADPLDFATAVESELFFLPEEFFTREWTEKGLDTSERRKFLRSQMDEAITKAGSGLGYLPLFRAKA